MAPSLVTERKRGEAAMAGRYEAPSIDDHGDLAAAGQKKAEGKEGNMPNNNLLRFIAHAHQECDT